MSKQKIAIIGGGVSGVTLALLTQTTYDVTIYEREKDILLKLLKTGNGKANIFNRGIKLSAYNDQTFMVNHYQHIEDEVSGFFNRLGIVTYTDDEGRVYPFSRSAKTLRENFRSHLRAKVLTETNVRSVTKESNGFFVNDELYDYVVIATGSSASLFKYDIANNNTTLMRSLNLATTSFVPVIKTIEVRESLKMIRHERIDAKLSLYQGETLLKTERGEILFKDNGLSGIVSFIVSSYFEWAHQLDQRKPYKVIIDFMPDHTHDEVTKLIKSSNDLTKVFSANVATFLASQNGNIINNIKSLTLTPLANNYPENAQAMHGGIKLIDITDNFNFTNNPTLFALGEALNIDGICGGYNLGFAFYSAIRASAALLLKTSKQPY